MAAAFQFPADPALRRQLWRQWVHLDPPRGDKPAAPVRRVDAKPEDWARATIQATPGVVDGLRTAIAAAVIDGQLSLEDRQRFIARAVRLGLTRFDASLLVAAVQHRAREERADQNGFTVRAVWKRPAKRRSIATIVAACLALEAIGVTALMLWLRA